MKRENVPRAPLFRAKRHNGERYVYRKDSLISSYPKGRRFDVETLLECGHYRTWTGLPTEAKADALAERIKAGEKVRCYMCAQRRRRRRGK